ncbi:hypothetical protein OG921_18990 [Aldersonia sp. NBC_00410]|uniref:BTAD domain-containing putative transcriptional regulator n=1 Tax=Aldersonia sp. NBC_00410 TaxID=2975954 RepID=UPI00225B12F5|nr:BTAD domain-containing putative transcriptional regulator [Aldersonia sp. NBC_00410]MCX5045257.1 hypothetical protein [Aldersonia sp. NBC_00410]
MPIATAAQGYSQLHEEVTDALIAAGLADGRADEIGQHAAAAATADPLREPAILLHMRTLAASGQVPEALRTGRAFRRRHRR